ncbi:DUF5067 domain-containing protein [Desemzia sp. C1]|uniref:DUF5067 domain-containing protein n=1 Tax=Desemzia sp. C1 TaxID=2892016 RepID=UPI001E4BEC1C|nr:DUF5067 domain-containing protein [Desemzia sp. C1]MCI3029834.1 DUF5067 domain-containing protein [Desemzia sp. C1]
MRLNKLLIVPLFFLVSACESGSVESVDIPDKSSSESSSELTQAEWIEQNVPESEFFTVTYENDILTTEYGTFEFKESKYVEVADSSPTVIVRFDYKNTTDENQNIESVIWNHFDGKQVFENTTEPTGYLIMYEEDPYYDEYYNTQVEVNPGATVPAAYGITLNDSSAPLTLDFIDELGDVIGSKEFLLK